MNPSTGELPSSVGQFRTAPPDMPIPDRLNFVLVCIVFAAAVALLWFASRVTNWWALLAIGIVFSYVLLTNYALLHEATHSRLQSSERGNYWLGVVTGLLFPMPFSMVRHTHQGHHQFNRTDAELFDLYYPTDNRVVKYIRWYGILCGMFWPLIPLGAVLYAIAPGALTAIFRRPGAGGYLFGSNPKASVSAVRFELLLLLAFFAGLFWLLDLRWQNTLVLYACFSFNWSTRQYVGHAFTKRDVIEGAWNLRHNRLMSLLLLHSEYDLNHHRYPEVSWYYLPRLSRPDEERPSYFKQYWRQWLGPRLATEPEPALPSSSSATVAALQ
jgi:fatty acid desaturase